MHIKYLCTVHTTPITVDRHVRITDPGGIRANVMIGYIYEQEPIIFNSSARGQLLCQFVCAHWLLLSAAASDSLMCLRILDLMYYFIFVPLWWTRKDTIRALEWRIWTHLCVQYKLLPIQHQLLWKVFKKISIFHIFMYNSERILIRFIKILWMLQQ